MTKGRKPDPERQKRGTGNRPAQGTVRVRAALPPGGTTVEVVDPFPPPPGLAEEVHDLWRAIVADLGGANHMRQTYVPAVAAYCEAVYLHTLATEELRREGLWTMSASGAMVASPMIRVQKDAASTMLRYAESLGLTPAGRIRLGLMEVAGASLLSALNASLDGSK